MVFVGEGDEIGFTVHREHIRPRRLPRRNDVQLRELLAEAVIAPEHLRAAVPAERIAQAIGELRMGDGNLGR